MAMKQSNMIKVFIFLLTVVMVISTSAATTNMIIITDPTGQDPNGAAAGSMSYATNMFQSTFLYSQTNHFAVLSGGEGSAIPRLEAVTGAINKLENNATPADAANTANSYSGIRVMCGGPTVGAAVGGYFDAYVITVADDGTISINHSTSGVAVLPAGVKGAIIHLRNTEGNPLYGTADTVRLQTAENIGKMIRDGYPATYIIGQAFNEVATDSGENHGGGAINLVSGISTGDMFTPAELNETGFVMNDPYMKVDPETGWSVNYPAAENYQTDPDTGTSLKIVYAYQALENAITVTSNSTSVSVYGSDELGITETTQEIVAASVKKHGYNANEIAKDLNAGINSGLLVGVNYVEPKDINVKESTRAVGVYFKPLSDSRTSPSWDLPISSSVLNMFGNIQTAIGLILVILVLFRSTLIKSFLKK